jgi:nucleoside-diphosphate-sugar epimerase
MRYFLTGATGFIGGSLARQLRVAGHEVVALVRNPAKAQSLAQLGVQLSSGDITDKDSMRKPMTGADGVFHLAAWYQVGARDTSQADAINVEGTRNVLTLMQELNIPKGVYTSTVAVNSDTGGRVVDESYQFTGEHLSAYDRTKWRAHYEVALPLMKAGLPLVIVQPGVNYGPGDTSSIGDALRQYLQGKLPLAPAGAAYCWAHVDDTARGHMQAMERGKTGESYIIAGPPHTLVEVLQLAEQITGIKAPGLQAPPWLLRTFSAVMGALEAVVPVPEQYSAETLRVSAGATYLGTSAKAERELGFQARPLAEGLRETLAYEMTQLGIRPRR